MSAILEVRGLRKSYADGFEALKGVDLDIHEGEIIALLGPNGAGKTTLISTVCGITMPTAGTVTVGGHDIQRDFRAARQMIGLVPQEISLEPFSKVINSVQFSRGLFGKSRGDSVVEDTLQTAEPLGQARQPDQGTLRRHEAPGADRQGAGA